MVFLSLTSNAGTTERAAKVLTVAHVSEFPLELLDPFHFSGSNQVLISD